MIRRLLLSVSLLSLCLLAAPSIASAKDLFNGSVCKSGSSAASSAVCQDKTSSNPLTGDKGALLNIANIVAYVAGAAAIIVIVVSALRFVTSGSDISTNSRTDSDVENARRALAGAVIGLVVIVLAKTLINYVVKKL